MTEHQLSSARSLDTASVPLRAAYQGVAGAFGEAAVNQLWNGQTEAVASPTFSEALEALLSGGVQSAVIPVWNSTIGVVTAAQRAIDARTSSIDLVGEIEIAVHHCLLALS